MKKKLDDTFSTDIEATPSRLGNKDFIRAHVCPNCGAVELPVKGSGKCPDCGFVSKMGDSAKTAKCPDCGSKYLVQTGYCVSCKKKVKKADTIPPGFRDRFFDGVGGAVSFSLTDRRFNLSEIRRAITVIAASFMQAYFQATRKTKDSLSRDSLEEMFPASMVPFGRDSLISFVSSFIDDSKSRKADSSAPVLVPAVKGKIAKINGILKSMFDNKILDSVPMDQILRVAESHGVQVVDSKGMPWFGVLLGSEGHTAFALRSEGVYFDTYNHRVYNPIVQGAELHLDWKYDDSGYKVTAQIKSEFLGEYVMSNMSRKVDKLNERPVERKSDGSVMKDLIKEFESFEKLVVTTRRNLGVLINKGVEFSDPKSMLNNLKTARYAIESVSKDI